MLGLIFTLVMTAGGSLAALVNPFIGLLVYISFAIIKPQETWHWSVPQGNYSRIVALALLAGWAFRLFGSWRLGRSTAIVVLLLGYMGWTVMGAVFAPDFETYWGWATLGTVLSPEAATSWQFVETLAKIVLPFLVGITVIDSRAKVNQLAWVIVLSQAFVAYEMNLSYLAEGYNRIRYEGFAGMDNNSAAIAMVTCIGLAFFLGFRTESWWKRGVAWMSALFMLHAVLLTFSRGGVLSLIVTAAVGFLLIPKRWPHYVGFAGAVCLGLYLAGPELRARFLTTFGEEDGRDYAAQSRLDLWKDCVDVMMRRPFYGVGPNNWPAVASEYGWPEGKEAHSLWFQTGAEQGFPGLALLLAFYGLCIWRLWRLRRRLEGTADSWAPDYARMVITSLVGFMVSAQFVSLEALETPYYVVLVGAAVLKLTPLPAVTPAVAYSTASPLVAPRPLAAVSTISAGAAR